MVVCLLSCTFRLFDKKTQLKRQLCVIGIGMASAKCKFSICPAGKACKVPSLTRGTYCQKMMVILPHGCMVVGWSVNCMDWIGSDGYISMVNPLSRSKYYGGEFVSINISGGGHCGWLERGSQRRVQAESCRPATVDSNSQSEKNTSFDLPLSESCTRCHFEPHTICLIHFVGHTHTASPLSYMHRP